MIVFLHQIIILKPLCQFIWRYDTQEPNVSGISSYTDDTSIEQASRNQDGIRQFPITVTLLSMDFQHYMRINCNICVDVGENISA